MIADLNVVYEGVGSGKDCEGNNRGREHCSQDKGYKLKGDGLQLTAEGKKERETRICVYEPFYSQ